MTRGEAEDQAKAARCPYVETSAKSGVNVRQAFDELVLEANITVQRQKKERTIQEHAIVVVFLVFLVLMVLSPYIIFSTWFTAYVYGGWVREFSFSAEMGACRID